MLWDLVKKYLDNCSIKIINQSGNKADFHGCQSFNTHIPLNDPNIIYWGFSSNLSSEIIQNNKPRALLICQDSPAFDFSILKNVDYVASTSVNKKFEECVEALAKDMELCKKYELGNRILVDLLTSNAPINDMANLIAETYGHFIAFVDTSIKLIGFSTTFPMPGNMFLEKHHDEHYIPSNTINRLISSGNLSKILDTVEPIPIEDFPGDLYSYVFPIIIGNFMRAGFLVYFVEKNFVLNPVEAYHLKKVTKLLSLEFQKSRLAHFSEPTIVNNIMYDFINGIRPVKHLYEEQFASFSYDLRKFKNIGVIPLALTVSQNIGAYVLADMIKKTFSNSIYTIFDDYIVFLTSRDTPSNIRSIPEYQDWNTSLNLLGIPVGFSETFEKSSVARLAFTHAKTALRIGTRLFPSHRFYIYPDMKIYDIVNTLAQSTNIRQFVFLPIYNIINYDTENNSDYLKTLNMYFKCHRSVKNTCEKLYIQRSTFYYRLDKIKELLDVNIDSPDIVHHIWFSFAILEYLGEMESLLFEPY